MIAFEQATLPNGLRVLVHTDHSTPLVALSVLYKVGSKDESPERTGFAHLFEHLMFGGSRHVADFDRALQQAGGDSNAFTNKDMTCFYCSLPRENLETALWLESDRMLDLSINVDKLEVQRRVVLEEFNETCLNAPYGDVWHFLSELAFERHPYRWPTIGKDPSHIREATLEEVHRFYQQYYHPGNAVLVMAGNVEPNVAFQLAEKWFGEIPSGPPSRRDLPAEPPQKSARKQLVKADVPLDALYLAFHIPERLHRDFYLADLFSDILGSGASSRLYRRLHKQQQLFSAIDAYITGTVDPGLLIIEGKPAEGVEIEQAREAIWQELRLLQEHPLPAQELQKLKHKVETNLLFSETSILNKAISLAGFDMLGVPERINQEVDLYRSIQAPELQAFAQQYLQPSLCNELHYISSSESDLIQ